MRSFRLTGGQTFRSLRIRNYRLWFVGQSISTVGFHAQVLGLAVLVLALTDSGTTLGWVMALYFIPNLLVGPWAGVLCDRMEKRRLLIATQTTMMVSALLLGGLVLADAATLTWIVVLAGTTGLAFAFDQPARRTIVTELVDADIAANAVTLNGALGQGAKLVGPAVAGVLVGTVGVGWCFMFNGASFVAVLAALIRMDPYAIQRTPPVARERGQVVEGFRLLWANHTARWLIALLAGVVFAGFNWNVLLPLLAERQLGGGAGTLAVLLGALSAGSLAGVLGLARRGQIPEVAVARGCIAMGLSSVALGAAPNVWFAVAASFVVGAMSMVLFNGALVILQLDAAPAVRGRTMAMFSMVVLGGRGIGSPVSGWIAQVLSARGAIAFGGIVSAALGLAALIVFLRQRDASMAETPVPQDPRTQRVASM